MRQTGKEMLVDGFRASSNSSSIEESTTNLKQHHNLKTCSASCRIGFYSFCMHFICMRMLTCADNKEDRQTVIGSGVTYERTNKKQGIQEESG